MKKLPKKYAGLLFTFYTSAMMVLIVSGVLVALNTSTNERLQRSMKMIQIGMSPWNTFRVNVSFVTAAPPFRPPAHGHIV